MTKQKKKGRTRSKVTNSAALPKGYEAIGGFGISWPNEDTEPGEMIVGVLEDFDEFMSGTGKDKREVQTVKLRTKDDKVYTLYSSVTLKALFDYEEGTEAAVIFDGYGAKKRGRNPAKLFRIGVK